MQGHIDRYGSPLPDPRSSAAAIKTGRMERLALANKQDEANRCRLANECRTALLGRCVSDKTRFTQVDAGKICGYSAFNMNPPAAMVLALNELVAEGKLRKVGRHYIVWC